MLEETSLGTQMYGQLSNVMRYQLNLINNNFIHKYKIILYLNSMWSAHCGRLQESKCQLQFGHQSRGLYQV